MEIVEPKVFFWMGAHDGCAWYRGMMPGYYADTLKDVGGFATTGSIDPQIEIEKCNIVVLQRRFLGPDMKRIEKIRASGKKIVVDMDDNLLNIPPNNPAHRIYTGKLRKDVEKQLREADLITVSTEFLGEQLKKYNKKIAVFPNCVDIDADWVDKNSFGVEMWHKSGICRTEAKGRKIRIGWTGSNTHEEDLRAINSVMLDLVSEREDVEILYMGGYPGAILEPLIKEKLITRGLDGKYHIPVEKIGKEKRIWLVNGIHISEYYAKLLSLGMHIGVAPLVDNNFNRCKSNVKFLEYTMAGIPTIASNVLPYSGTIKNGKNGIIVKSNRYRQWRRAIEDLVDDEKKRVQLWENARMTVEHRFNIKANVLLHKEVYRGLLN